MVRVCVPNCQTSASLRHSPQLRSFLMSPFHSVFRLSPSSAAPLSLLVICSQQIVLLFLSLYLSVFFDESRDLLSCLTVWACLRVCSPSPPPPLPSLLACRPVWQCYPATPVPRLQKPCLQLLRECQPVPGIPTSRENSLPHCYALIACQVPFLFCSLVFLPLFSFFIFSLCLFHGSFLCWQHPLCVFTLHSCPGPLNGPFISFLFFCDSG